MKNKIRLCLLLILLFFVLGGCGKNSTEIKSEMEHIENYIDYEDTEIENEIIYVYITDTGIKYHRESCISLKYSKTKCTLDEAEEKGLSECKLCKPVTYR